MTGDDIGQRRRVQVREHDDADTVVGEEGYLRRETVDVAAVVHALLPAVRSMIQPSPYEGCWTSGSSDSPGKLGMTICGRCMSWTCRAATMRLPPTAPPPRFTCSHFDMSLTLELIEPAGPIVSMTLNGTSTAVLSLSVYGVAKSPPSATRSPQSYCSSSRSGRESAYGSRPPMTYPRPLR